MNNVVLIGRVAKDIDLKFTPNGLAVAKFTIAINDGYGEKKTTDYINIVVFDKQAESCANYLDKGSKVAIQGKIKTGSYTTQTGEKRYTTEIIANRVEFIGSKQGQANANTFDDDNDIFQPVDDSDIPFN